MKTCFVSLSFFVVVVFVTITTITIAIITIVVMVMMILIIVTCSYCYIGMIIRNHYSFMVILECRSGFPFSVVSKRSILVGW